MVTFHRTHLKVTTVHLARKATEVECIDQQNHILTFTFSSWLLMISVLQGHGSPLLLLPCCCGSSCSWESGMASTELDCEWRRI